MKQYYKQSKAKSNTEAENLFKISSSNFPTCLTGTSQERGFITAFSMTPHSFEEVLRYYNAHPESNSSVSCYMTLIARRCLSLFAGSSHCLPLGVLAYHAKFVVLKLESSDSHKPTVRVKNCCSDSVQSSSGIEGLFRAFQHV